MSAQDPTWNPKKTARCNGNIRYESSSSWWVCEKCGRCGDHDFARAHRPINDPAVFLLESIQFFLERRKTEGIDRNLALSQMLHVAGTALRYAAAAGAGNLDQYLKRLTAQ